MAKALNYITYLIFLGAIEVAKVLPMDPTYKVGRWIAILVYHLVSGRRKIAIRNLAIAFGDKLTPAERNRIAREAMINLVYSGIEFLFMWRIARNWKEHFTFEGDQVITQHIIDKKPFFVFGGHLGGWMMLAMVVERWKEYGVRGGCIMRPQRNPYIDGYLRNLARNFNSMFIGTKGTGKIIEKCIMEGALVGFYMDQESKRKQGIQVDFFGLQAYSHVVPGYLAWKHRIPMYPFWIPRKKPGYFHIIYSEPIKMDYTGDKEIDIREVTQRIAKEVENTIREYPEQWLWFHNRWKRTLGEDKPRKSRKAKIDSGQYLTSSQLLKMMDEEIGEKKNEGSASTA